MCLYTRIISALLVLLSLSSSGQTIGDVFDTVYVSDNFKNGKVKWQGYALELSKSWMNEHPMSREDRDTLFVYLRCYPGVPVGHWDHFDRKGRLRGTSDYIWGLYRTSRSFRKNGQLRVYSYMNEDFGELKYFSKKGELREWWLIREQEALKVKRADRKWRNYSTEMHEKMSAKAELVNGEARRKMKRGQLGLLHLSGDTARRVVQFDGRAGEQLCFSVFHYNKAISKKALVFDSTVVLLPQNIDSLLLFPGHMRLKKNARDFALMSTGQIPFTSALVALVLGGPQAVVSPPILAIYGVGLVSYGVYRWIDRPFLPASYDMKKWKLISNQSTKQ